MSNFNRIKNQLSMSTTMPAIGGGAQPYMMGSAAHGHHHDHDHADDGSCCGHDHGHEHSHETHDAAAAEAEEILHDEDEECDNTSPKGGCGCC